MKSKTMIIAVLMAILVASANASVVVYEGFEYPEGEIVTGLGTATDGWAGAWATAGGDNLHKVAAGLSLNTFPVSGGAAQRPNRGGKEAINRQISAAAQAALTADDTTTWFSVLMNPGSNLGVTVGGFATNSYMTFILGDAELLNGEGWNAATIAAGGNAIGVGFAGTTEGLWENMRVQGVTYKDGAYTENTAQRIVTGDTTVLIVGQVEWAANGTNDVIKLYNVLDPKAPLPTAFSVMEEDLDQTAFNVVGVGDAQTSIIDEIRFGTSYEAVTYAPTPKNGDIVHTNSSLPLNWVNLDPYDPNDSVYVDVWFGTEPNELSGEYDMTKIVDAATTGEDRTTVDVDASAEDTYYWWVDSYLNGSAHINEPNKIAGPLHSFTTVADMPPSVVVDTLDKATWSDEPVPLQATVTDDGQSAVTIAWTADAVSLNDPNLAINITGGDTTTPTVTITKDAPGLGLRTVTMTISVTDENGYDPTPVTDTVDIDVYYDPCRMARIVLGRFYVEGATVDTDFNNDCITNLVDVAEFAAAWLGDYSSPGPLDRQ